MEKLDSGEKFGTGLKDKKLSWAEKKVLYERWKESGLNKNKFCKQVGLRLSTFCSWCTRLEKTKVVSENALCPIKIKAEGPMVRRESEEEVSIELKFPNQMAANVKIKGAQLGYFLKELADAGEVIR